jgi:hypothetical protein
MPNGPLDWRDHAGIHLLLFGSWARLGFLFRCVESGGLRDTERFDADDLRAGSWAATLASGLDVRPIEESF